MDREERDGLLVELLMDQHARDAARAKGAERENEEIARALNDTLGVCNDYYKKFRALRDLCARHHSAVAVADVMAVIGTDDKEDK